MDRSKFFKPVDVDKLFDPDIPEGISPSARRRLRNKTPENTLKTYKNQVRKFISRGYTIPCTETEMVNYLNQLHDEGFSESSIHLALYSITKAHRLAGLEFNPRDEWIKTIRKTIATESDNIVKGSPPLSINDLKKVIDLCRREYSNISLHVADRIAYRRDAALFLIMFATGSRISEVLNLRVGDISDNSQGVRINIRESKTNRTKEQWKATPWMDGDYCPGSELLDYMRVFGLDYNDPEQHDDYLFFATGRNTWPIKWYFRESRRNGRIKKTQMLDLLWIRRAFKRRMPNKSQINKKTYSRRVASIGNRIAMQDYPKTRELTPHAFRHGFVTDAANRGMPLHLIMEMTGHTSESTVLRYISSVSKYKYNASNGMFD